MNANMDNRVNNGPGVENFYFNFSFWLMLMYRENGKK